MKSFFKKIKEFFNKLFDKDRQKEGDLFQPAEPDPPAPPTKPPVSPPTEEYVPPESEIDVSSKGKQPIKSFNSNRDNFN